MSRFAIENWVNSGMAAESAKSIALAVLIACVLAVIIIWRDGE